MSIEIICIDDEEDFLVHVQQQLGEQVRCHKATTLNRGLDLLRETEVDVVLLDIELKSRRNGLDGLRVIREKYPDMPVVMLTCRRTPEIIVQTMQLGASHYLCKPFETEELLTIVTGLANSKRQREKIRALHESLKEGRGHKKMLGNNATFLELLRMAARLKGTSAGVLITGASGTGKELLARYIHDLEQDSKRPFIDVACASIPQNLIESELFGHERYAFTEAKVRRIGKFELADGGDLFLDEIGCLRPEVQDKLLRVIQEKEFCRVGGNIKVSSDFRIISATSADLEHMVEEGSFRRDLFFRLKVVPLHLPSLKDRRDDIPLFVREFIKKYSNGSKSISNQALELLVNAPWIGNIRELENVIHSLVILTSDDVLDVKHIPATIKHPRGKEKNVQRELLDIRETDGMTLKEFTKRAEEIFVRRAIDRNNGNVDKAADELQIGRSTLYSKIK